MSSAAEIKPDLVNSYLQDQFDWAMYMDVHKADHYLNYVGSKLHPLTKVRIRFRYFPKHLGQATWPAKTYEELWYQDGKPIGLRRYGQITVGPKDIGAVILGMTEDHFKSSLASANALVRLMVEMRFRQTAASAVLVQPGQFDQLVVDLQRYHFFPGMPQPYGPQLNIHLRCDPNGPEQSLYLHWR